jgi:hypothetical protein
MDMGSIGHSLCPITTRELDLRRAKPKNPVYNYRGGECLRGFFVFANKDKDTNMRKFFVAYRLYAHNWVWNEIVEFESEADMIESYLDDVDKVIIFFKEIEE